MQVEGAFSPSLRTLGYVPRWGILRLIKQQSVLEHTALVAIYAAQIADIIEWKGDRIELYRAALEHDWPEVEVSDIPSPMKAAMPKDQMDAIESEIMERRFGEKRKVTDPEVLQILHTADILEPLLFLIAERRMGNHSVSKVLDIVYSKMMANINKYDEGVRFSLICHVNQAIRDEWNGQHGIIDPKLKSPEVTMTLSQVIPGY